MLFAASLGCVALLGYFLVSFFQVYATGRDDQVRSVDAIVVMGAAQYDGRPSPQLAARLDHVAELWPQGFAPVVVVTGGNQAGDRFTEAEASTTYLVERGVPEASIVLEDRGTTSFESLERVAHLLAESTGSNDSSVLVVTDPYHSLRSRRRDRSCDGLRAAERAHRLIGAGTGSSKSTVVGGADRRYAPVCIVR